MSKEIKNKRILLIKIHFTCRQLSPPVHFVEIESFMVSSLNSQDSRVFPRKLIRSLPLKNSKPFSLHLGFSSFFHLKMAIGKFQRQRPSFFFIVKLPHNPILSSSFLSHSPQFCAKEKHQPSLLHRFIKPTLNSLNTTTTPSFSLVFSSISQNPIKTLW